MKLKKFLLLASIIIVSLVNISTSYSIEPDIFVQSTVNRASQALNSNSSKLEKIEKLKDIAEETVDIKGLGFYTLGSYRKTISEDHKKEYDILFKQYFLKTFSSRLAEYSNPEIEVKSKKELNKNYTMVSSVLVATEKRPEVKIEWRIYTKNPDNLKIRDLIIEGLSLARTQKEEFSSIIESNDGDMNALLTSLKKFIK
jgi:phospholipid transport system substrate-binding protein|tara:strand:- start:57 stop:653 length:597 start_codon:yes stop_codon:yes gene_type:complete